MAKERGRPRELPEDLVYLRLAVTPLEHRQIRVATGLAGGSMAQFARRAVVEAAREALAASGLDPDRLPEAPMSEKPGQAEQGGPARGASRRGGRRRDE